MSIKLRVPSCPQARVSFAIGVVLTLAGLVVTAGVPTLASSFVRVPYGGANCSDRVQARLFFGLYGPDGLVSDAEWEGFLADAVTPRFPLGLTVLRADGQWRGVDDLLVREPSRVVEIVHNGSADDGRRIGEIVAIYKERYQQSSVMVARSRIEACF